MRTAVHMYIYIYVYIMYICSCISLRTNMYIHICFDCCIDAARCIHICISSVANRRCEFCLFWYLKTPGLNNLKMITQCQQLQTTAIPPQSTSVS